MLEIIEKSSHSNEEKYLMNYFAENHKWEFDYCNPIPFNSSTHLKNFLCSYAFNLNPKNENEATKDNAYFVFDNEEKRLCRKNSRLNSRTEREEVSLSWFNTLKDIPYTHFCNDIIYLGFNDERLIKEMENDEDMCMFGCFLISAYANLKYEVQGYEVKYCILHLNQEAPHLHRILVKKA